MKLTADYHTHTTFSHGKGTILDNAKHAKEVGLEEICISDHGFNHVFFGMKRKKLAKMRELAREAEKETGVKVYIGMEADIISLGGAIDAKKQDGLDFIVLGFHKCVWTKPFQFFRLCVSNILREKFMGRENYHKAPINKGWVKRNTNALCKAIEKNANIVDAISHPNRHFRVDTLKVAKACEKHGVAFELNAKSFGLSLDELKQIVKKTKVNFIISSDAHMAQKVGSVQNVFDKIKGIVPAHRILNIDGKKLIRKKENEFHKAG